MKNIIFAILLLGLTANAQMGVIDNSFNAIDNGSYKQLVFNQFNELDYVGSTPVMLPNGKVLVIATWESKIYRFNADGTIDTTFQSPNLAAGTNYVPYDMLYLQPDGKILVVHREAEGIMRINQDGSIDTTFTSPVFTALTSPIYLSDVDFQADGKILITGTFLTVNGITQKRFTRLNSNGSVDTTFNMNTGFNDVTYSVAVQPDGKIIVVGLFLSYNTSALDHIVRINPDGSVDTSFALTSGSYFIPDGAAYGVEVTSAGKIVVVGTNDLYRYNNQNRKSVVRLNSNGSFDTTFNATSAINTLGSPTIDVVTLQPNGKILIYKAESSETNPQNYFRLNSDGSKDTGFNSTMVMPPAFIRRMIVQPDGKIIIGGSYNNPTTGITRNVMHRVNQDGSLDVTFLRNTGTNNVILRSFIQQDRKILLAGNFTTYNDMPARNIARIDADGNFDSSFTIDPSIKLYFSSGFPVIKQQPDGKILLSGSDYRVNGITKNIIRLNLNGSIDTSFNCEAGSVLDFEILPDGKIIACGSSGNFTTGGSKLLRFNTNGTTDTTYPTYSFNAAPFTLELLPNGKLLVAGSFSTYNNSSVRKLIRLNADGTHDSSFYYTNPVNYPTNVLRTLTQPDGKIVVSFVDTWNDRASIARLNSDGSVDTSFTINSGTGNADDYSGFTKMILLEDGRIIVPRFRTSFNSQPAPDLILLNANGTWDSTFNPPASTGASFYSLLGCDRIIATGGFATIGIFPKNNIAAINASLNPVAPSATAIQYVNPGATIANLNATGQNILWYLDPVICDDSYNPQYTARNADNAGQPLPLSTTLVNGTTYFGTQTVNGLQSSFGVAVKVIFNASAGIDEISALAEIKAYPNPTSGIVTISGDIIFSRIEVYNTVGQLIFCRNYQEKSADIDLTGVNAGLYMVRIITENGLSTRTIVKK